jgi:hypothetical protein
MWPSPIRNVRRQIPSPGSSKQSNAKPQIAKGSTEAKIGSSGASPNQ